MSGLYSEDIYAALRAAARSGPIGSDQLRGIARDLQVDAQHVVAHAWDLVEDEGWSYGADAHFIGSGASESGCGFCLLADVLVRMSPGPRVVKVIADHVRYEHEPVA